MEDLGRRESKMALKFGWDETGIKMCVCVGGGECIRRWAAEKQTLVWAPSLPQN